VKGIRAVHPTFSTAKIFYSKRHFSPKNSKDIDLNRTNIKTFYNTQENNPQCQNKICESTLEFQMGRKHRINYNVETRVPGEKLYKNPECSSNYFHEGGLVPQVTWRKLYSNNVTKKTDNFYKTLDLNKKIMDQSKLWTRKIEREEKEFDKTYVKTLTEWEKNIFGEEKKEESKIVDKKVPTKTTNPNSSVKAPAKKNIL
jgi:hypothetical protein